MGDKPALGRFWWPRYQLARGCIHFGLAIMPNSRYKHELLAALWALRWKVEAEVERSIE